VEGVVAMAEPKDAMQKQLAESLRPSPVETGKRDASHFDNREEMRMDETPGRRRVRFTEDTTENSAVFTPSRKPHHSAIRKKWLQLCDEDDYVGLQQYLVACEKKGVSMKDFFRSEGLLILTWAVASAPDIMPLEFIYKNVSQDVLQEVLRQENGYVLKEFLSAEMGMDACHWTNELGLENRIKKFKLLLGIDAEWIGELMENTALTRPISEGVKASFTDAFESYRRAPQAV
jgi:hypothetical protein